jgi:CRP-like cAMP-binding protein
MTAWADLDFLRTVGIFAELDATHLQALAERLRPRTLRRGEVLFREGDGGQELYILRAGTVLVSKLVLGRVEQVLARLGPGELLGDMSLFDGAPRSATVTAESDAAVLCLDREGLHLLTEASPRAAAAFFFQMGRVFTARLRESGNLVAEVTRWGLEATGLDVEGTRKG